LLPSILFFSILILTLPVSFLGINLFSCFSQINLKDPTIYAFAWFYNITNFNLLGNFPYSIFTYFGRICLGFFITVFALPIISGLASLGVWVYLLSIMFLWPLFLIFVGGMNWKDCVTQIVKQIMYHKIGLCVIFLFYSIAIAYKNFNKPIAFGTHLGIVILILLLLNIFVIIKNTIMSLISGNTFKTISKWLYGTC
jgi:hypothetical protein